jgi:hypothetical protein
VRDLREELVLADRVVDRVTVTVCAVAQFDVVKVSVSDEAWICVWS